MKRTVLMVVLTEIFTQFINKLHRLDALQEFTKKICTNYRKLGPAVVYVYIRKFLYLIEIRIEMF